MRNTPTALDLNGPHPVKSEMQLFLESYGSVGLTLLVMAHVNNTDRSSEAAQATGRELANALRKLESALSEASKLPENQK